MRPIEFNQKDFVDRLDKNDGKKSASSFSPAARIQPLQPYFGLLFSSIHFGSYALILVKGNNGMIHNWIYCFAQVLHFFYSMG